MKKYFTVCFCIISLCLLTIRSVAQTFEYYITNDHLVSTTVYELDVYIRSTSTDFKIRTAQHCITFNPAFIASGSTITPSYVMNSTQLLSYNVGTITWSDTAVGFQTSVNIGGTCATGTVIDSITPVRVATFRLQSTLPFNCAPANPSMGMAGDTTIHGLGLRMAITKWLNPDCSTTLNASITNNGVYTHFSPRSGYGHLINMAPVITTQPLSAATCNSGHVLFSVVATGNGFIGPQVTYQWYENGVAVTNGTTANGTYSGATSATLNIANPNGTNGHQFYCVVTQCNSDTSTVAILTNNSNDNNACTIDNCDTLSGSVTHTPINTSDGNPCTTDACDPANGNVSHSPIVTNDNNACTTDGCDPVTGVFHTPMSTTDNNPCTLDACDAVTGQVSHTLISTDDGNACTTDGCDAVTGVYHTQIAISDNDACTIDACDQTSGNITHTPVVTDDSNACTTDGCDNVTGVYHISVNINDNDSCTFDNCNTNTGAITHTNITPASPSLTVSDSCGYSIVTASGFSGTLHWNTNESTPSITVTTVGFYSVTQSINGCVSPAGTIAANPFEVPSVHLGNDTSIISGGSLLLNAGSGFLTYTWSTGATTQTITANTTGSYWVHVTNNDCTGGDTIFIDFTNGIQNLQLNNSIIVYPNPSHGIFSVAFDQPIKNCIVEIYNHLDQCVYKNEWIEIAGKSSKEIKLSLASGIYQLKIVSDKGSLVKSIAID